MKNEPLTIVLTGAGAPGIRGTLHAVNYNPCKTPVRTIGVDLDPDAVGRFFVDRFYRVPPPEEDGYIDRLLDICGREKAHVILPQTTREIFALSGRKTDFQEHGVSVAVSDRSAIEVANNKLKVLECFRDLGLPHPAFLLARSEAELVRGARQLGYPDRPVVVKPAVSNGMRGVRILKEAAWDVRRFLTEKPGGLDISLESLLSILARGDPWPELLVTEFLPGVEYTVDAFRGSHVQFAIPRVRRAIRSGITFDSVVERREDIERPTLLAAEQIGLRHVFGFQFKLDGRGVPKVLECNPRVQGTMVTSALAGANVIWYAIEDCLNRPLRHVPEIRRDVRFQRYWGGVGSWEGGDAEI